MDLYRLRFAHVGFTGVDLISENRPKPISATIAPPGGGGGGGRVTPASAASTAPRCKPKSTCYLFLSGCRLGVFTLLLADRGTTPDVRDSREAG